MNTIHVTETLYHFQCQHCNGWWSIGDWTPKKYMWCPHCGKRSEIEQQEESKWQSNANSGKQATLESTGLKDGTNT